MQYFFVLSMETSYTYIIVHLVFTSILNTFWFPFCVVLILISILVSFSAYQNNDISEFEKILKTNRRNIMEDPFIREHIEGG